MFPDSIGRAIRQNRLSLPEFTAYLAALFGTIIGSVSIASLRFFVITCIGTLPLAWAVAQEAVLA